MALLLSCRSAAFRSTESSFPARGGPACFGSCPATGASAFASAGRAGTGASFFSGAATGPRAPRLSKSICPTTFGPFPSLASVAVLISTGFSSGSAMVAFFSLCCRLRLTAAASSLNPLSFLNSATNIWYCSSEILVLGLASTSLKPFFCRNSTAVWSPTLHSLVTLFSLMLILVLILPQILLLRFSIPRPRSLPPDRHGIPTFHAARSIRL